LALIVTVPLLLGMVMEGFALGVPEMGLVSPFLGGMSSSSMRSVHSRARAPHVAQAGSIAVSGRSGPRLGRSVRDLRGSPVAGGERITAGVAKPCLLATLPFHGERHQRVMLAPREPLAVIHQDPIVLTGMDLFDIAQFAGPVVFQIDQDLAGTVRRFMALGSQPL